MLRARLRAGSTRPERARELIAADIASAWRDDDDGGRGRSPRARPRDMPASSLADLGGAVRGDASLGTIPRSMRGIDGARSRTISSPPSSRPSRGRTSDTPSARASPSTKIPRFRRFSVRRRTTRATVRGERVARARALDVCQPRASVPAGHVEARLARAHRDATRPWCPRGRLPGGTTVRDADLKVDLRTRWTARRRSTGSAGAPDKRGGEHVEQSGERVGELREPQAVRGEPDEDDARGGSVARLAGGITSKARWRTTGRSTNCSGWRSRSPTRLLFKTLRGQPLTRRERKQMTRHHRGRVPPLVPFAGSS